jgi:hypothetical protein
MKSLLHETSTNLHSSQYDLDKKELRVTFKNGGNPGVTYRYPGFPADEWANLEAVHNKGESVGKHFHLQIRSKYKGEPVE